MQRLLSPLPAFADFYSEGTRGKDGLGLVSFSRLVPPYTGTTAAVACDPDRYGVKGGIRMGTYDLLGQASGNLAWEFIYSRPYALFNHIRSSIPVRGTARAQNPQLRNGLAINYSRHRIDSGTTWTIWIQDWMKLDFPFKLTKIGA